MGFIWASSNTQGLAPQGHPVTILPAPSSKPVCDSVALKSYLIRQDFLAMPFSVLLKMLGKNRCKNGSCKPSQASSHSGTDLSPHHLFQGKIAKVRIVLCVDVKHTTLHGQDVTASPLSWARRVAKERSVPGYGAGKRLPKWTLWSGLTHRRMWVFLPGVTWRTSWLLFAAKPSQKDILTSSLWCLVSTIIVSLFE